jgi:hypothetical protein
MGKAALKNERTLSFSAKRKQQGKHRARSCAFSLTRRRISLARAT